MHVFAIAPALMPAMSGLSAKHLISMGPDVAKLALAKPAN